MKLYITEPRTPGTPLSRQLKKHWYDMGAFMYVAMPHDIHGDILNRVWHEVRYPSGVPSITFNEIIVISELDFYLPEAGLQKLTEWPWEERALFTPYIEYTTGKSVRHEGLAGAWFIALNMKRLRDRYWPSPYWLAQDGPFNDAANMAPQKAISSGFLKEGEIRWLETKDLAPARILQYPELENAAHLFYSGYYNRPPDFELVPGTGYTMGEHFEHIKTYLRSQNAL